MSHQIDDLIENAPGWLLRSGISMVAIITALTLILAAVIRFPDKLTCTGIMSSATPPIEHKSIIEGVIDTIYVKDNESVEAGAALVLIQNSCKVSDLKKLSDFIKNFEELQDYSQVLHLKFPTRLQLGEIQKEYTELENRFLEFVIQKKEAALQQQMAIIEVQIIRTDKLLSVLADQKELAEKQLALVNKDNRRNALLKEQNVISDMDMEKSDRELITFQNQFLVLENTLIENQIRKEQLRLEKQKLRKEITDFETKSMLAIDRSISTLRHSIKVWEERYVVSAKVSGTVSFDAKITSKARINATDPIVTIIPPSEAQRKFVLATSLHSFGVGKIRPGEKAILKIDNYPYKEYGVIVSSLLSVSKLPVEDRNGNANYQFIIPLKDTIKTSYGVEIPYKPNTVVAVEIITEDKSLLERVFSEFLNLVNPV